MGGGSGTDEDDASEVGNVSESEDMSFLVILLCLRMRISTQSF